MAEKPPHRCLLCESCLHAHLWMLATRVAAEATATAAVAVAGAAVADQHTDPVGRRRGGAVVVSGGGLLSEFASVQRTLTLLRF